VTHAVSGCGGGSDQGIFLITKAKPPRVYLEHNPSLPKKRILNFARDQHQWLQWLFEAKKRLSSENMDLRVEKLFFGIYLFQDQ
jgi:hypothetical protein